jgi:hypothetical protein
MRAEVDEPVEIVEAMKQALIEAGGVERTNSD